MYEWDIQLWSELCEKRRSGRGKPVLSWNSKSIVVFSGIIFTCEHDFTKSLSKFEKNITHNGRISHANFIYNQRWLAVQNIAKEYLIIDFKG